MKKTLILDCTSYGPVIDTEGMMDRCFSNLEFLLIFLHEEYPNLRRGMKCHVLKSRLGYERKSPVRWENKIVKTIGQLIQEYSRWNRSGGSFDLEQARYNRKCVREAAEQEGKRRAAWGGFVQSMSHQRAVERERDYVEKIDKASSENERNAIRARKKKEENESGSLMYIG